MDLFPVFRHPSRFFDLFYIICSLVSIFNENNVFPGDFKNIWSTFSDWMIAFQTLVSHFYN